MERHKKQLSPLAITKRKRERERKRKTEGEEGIRFFSILTLWCIMAQEQYHHFSAMYSDVKELSE